MDIDYNRDPFASPPPPPPFGLCPALARAVLRCLGRRRRLSPGALLGLPRVLEEMAADALAVLVVEGRWPGLSDIQPRLKNLGRWLRWGLRW